MPQDLSKEARRIESEKPDAWEYLLASEVLNTEMKPVLQRWGSLKRCLYSNPTCRVARKDSVEWMQDRLSEMTNLTESFDVLSNEEFAKAWGAPGEPGDADAIINTSRLFAEMCATALAWEERVRFAAVDPIFEPVRALFVGVAGSFIDEATKLPAFMSEVLSDENADGTHTLSMVLTVPDGWATRVQQALHDATEDFFANPA